MFKKKINKGMKEGLKVIITGASGLVGSELLKLLAANDRIDAIKVFARRDCAVINNKQQNYIIDMSDIAHYAQDFSGDIYFCCLGTTMAQAGSKEAFKKVDYDLVCNTLTIAASNQVETVCLVSSLGADAHSNIYYSHIKGLTEDALKNMNFKRSFIFRPSLLIGPRNHLRPSEKLAQITAPLWNNFLFGKLAKYKSIQAITVANAMMQLAISDNCAGFNIFESDKIQSFGI